MKYNAGDKLHGFVVTRARHSDELNGTLVEMKHEKSGAQLVWLDNGARNKLFSIGFKTLPEDSTGVFHILEHSTLCGSKKYPVREPFVELMKSSMKTFLNAITWPDKTVYPISSRNDEDFINLTSVYMDAVFAPRFLEDPNIFYQEGWHVEQNEGELSYKGVVFNEMKGAMSDEGELISQKLIEMLFPDNCYGFNSGGDPVAIPDLTYEQFIDTYNRFYHPSNSKIYLDGDIPVDKTFALLDEYLCQYEVSSDLPVINMQAPVASEETIYYEIGPGQDMKDKGRLTFGKIFGEWTDQVKAAAAYILSDVLMGSNEAPIKQAVLESGLAPNVSMAMDDSGAQHYFWITAKDIKDGSDAEIIEIIRKKAAEVIKAGLDKDALHAAINRMEFRLRSPEEPQGLFRCFHALTGWLHEGDPMETMEYGHMFAALRENVDNGYFEKLTGELLIDDAGLAVLHTLPSTTLGEEMRKVENERLDKVKAGWSEADWAENKLLNEKLVAWQQTPDTPEQLATLPVLDLSAISEEPEFTPTEEKEVGGVKLLYHPVDTNGVVHVNAYFKLTDFAFDELPALSMLPRLLGKLPTDKHDALTLQQLVKRYVGMLEYSLYAYARLDDTSECVPMLAVNCSVLEQNLEMAEELIVEILTGTDFEQSELIGKIATQAEIAARQIGVSSGHSLGILSALSHYSANGAVSDAVSGYKAIRWLKGFVGDMEASMPGLIAMMKRVQEKNIVKARMVLGLTSTKPVCLKKLVDGLADGEAAPEKAAYNDDLPHRMGAQIPAQASFAVQGWHLEKDAANDAGYNVAANIVTLDYLWNKVRVQGGAYGVGLSVENSGNIYAYSFRDPTPGRTLDVYAGAADYLDSFCEAGESIDKYIISTMAKFEPLQSPRAQGAAADAAWFAGIDAGDYGRMKKEILHTDHAKLREFAKILRKFAADGAVCVVGHEAALQKCDGLTLKEL